MAASAPLIDNEKIWSKDVESEPCCSGFLPRATSGMERDALWDNMKGICQLFVVCMHAGGMVSTLSFGHEQELPFKFFVAFQTWIGFFTMPVFSFISGLFTSSSPSRRQMVGTLRLAVTFLISHLLAMVFTLRGEHQQELLEWHAQHPGWNRTVAGDAGVIHPPGWLPVAFFQFGNLDWYIWCIVLWRLVLPVAALLRYPLVVSFMLAGMTLFTDANTTVYTCTPFLFMPYFLAGFQWKEHKQDLKVLVKSRTLQMTFVVFSIFVMGACVLNDRAVAVSNAPLMCMYAQGALDDVAADADDTAQDVLGYIDHVMDPRNRRATANPPLEPDVHPFCESTLGVLSVSLFYVVSFFSLFGLMSFVPHRELWMVTKAGANTLYIYLTQIFFAVFPLALVSHIFIDWHVTGVPAAASVLIFCLSSACCWACLAQKWVKAACFVCVEPPVEYFLRGTQPG